MVLNVGGAAKLLLSHDNILIVTHKNPDGDTLGSSAALCHALNRAGIRAYMFNNPQITEKYLRYVRQYLAPDDFKYDYIVSVDVPADDMLSRRYKGSVNFCIDHHPTNPGYATDNCIQPERSSTGEIVLEIIEQMHGCPDKTEADLLYIALSTDTGCFQYANTNSGSFASASRLLQYGADNTELNTVFFRKVKKARLLLESMIYDSMEFYRGEKIAVATVTKKMIADAGADEDDCEDLAGLPGRVENEILGVTIRENDDGSSKVSLRSNSDVDSSEICRKFGGGGHKMASGCTIYESPDKAKELILKAIDEVWR